MSSNNDYCRSCDETFPEHKLNQTAKGLICNACFYDVDNVDMVKGAMARPKALLFSALTFWGLSFFVPFLLIVCFALCVGGVLITLSIWPVEKESSTEHRVFQMIYIATFMAIAEFTLGWMTVAEFFINWSKQG